LLRRSVCPVIVVKGRRRREHGLMVDGETETVLFSLDVVSVDGRSVRAVREGDGRGGRRGEGEVGSFVPYP